MRFQALFQTFPCLPCQFVGFRLQCTRLIAAIGCDEARQDRIASFREPGAATGNLGRAMKGLRQVRKARAQFGLRHQVVVRRQAAALVHRYDRSLGDGKQCVMSLEIGCLVEEGIVHRDDGKVHVIGQRQKRILGALVMVLRALDFDIEAITETGLEARQPRAGNTIRRQDRGDGTGRSAGQQDQARMVLLKPLHRQDQTAGPLALPIERRNEVNEIAVTLFIHGQ